MSEERKPTETPSGQQGQAALDQAQDMLKGAGIDIDTAIKALILAAVSGLVAALLDAVIGLPTGALAFAFGWFVAALNGPSYAFFTESYKLDGLIMSAVSGLVTLLVWFIVASIVLGDPEASASGHNLYKYFVDDLNILKAMIGGLIVGMLGFGWFALLRRLPEKLIPR
jgi:hypothetical protein